MKKNSDEISQLKDKYEKEIETLKKDFQAKEDEYIKTINRYKLRDEVNEKEMRYLTIRMLKITGSRSFKALEKVWKVKGKMLGKDN